jgi:RNA exonuclease 1
MSLSNQTGPSPIISPSKHNYSLQVILLISCRFSGITEEMLAPVTTTLADIQETLIKILHPRTVLIGHSLNSDLNALKITHPFIIDTAIIYPHPRGPPLKSSLKYLAQKYLSREIQKGHGAKGPGAGHDSIEDAKTCLDLVKQKCEKGKQWGTSDAQGENIFKRVARAGVRYKNQGGSAVPSPLNGKSSAMIDWGEPKKGPGAAANFPIGCQSDQEVMQAVIRAVKGDPDGKEIPGGGVDFVWGRFRELEALKGWWNNNKQLAAKAAASQADTNATNQHMEMASSDSQITMKSQVESNNSSSATFCNSSTGTETTQKNASQATKIEGTPTPTTLLLPPSDQDSEKSVDTVALELTQRIAQVYDQLPPCTALMIYSGSGDPREMSRLQAMQTQYRREFKVRKWDQLSVKWTDVEEQALKRAVRSARDGIAFLGIK